MPSGRDDKRKHELMFLIKKADIPVHISVQAIGNILSSRGGLDLERDRGRSEMSVFKYSITSGWDYFIQSLNMFSNAS